MDKCQCQHIGDVSEDRLNEYNEVTERPYVNHAPDECKCTNDLALYLVDGKRLCYALAVMSVVKGYSNDPS